MKYYIVALFDEETYQIISPIQRNMSKKFRANRNSPLPFIPLVSVENPNMDKLYPIIEKIVSPYKSFRIDASNLVTVSESSKSVNLKIDTKGYIKRLSRCFFDSLVLNNFNAKPFNENFVSLANLNYISKDSKKQEIKLNFPDLYNDSDHIKLRIKSIEVWKLPVVKKIVPLQKYELKNF